MEITKSGKLRKWKTTCPNCRTEVKYTKADVTRKESNTPVNILISPKVKVDTIICPDCGKEIMVYYNNEEEV